MKDTSSNYNHHASSASQSLVHLLGGMTPPVVPQEPTLPMGPHHVSSLGRDIAACRPRLDRATMLAILDDVLGLLEEDHDVLDIIDHSMPPDDNGAARQ